MTRNKRKSISPEERRRYLFEVNELCPLCGAPLIVMRNKRRTNCFDIAHIYPCHPTLEDYQILSNIQMTPEQIESFSNKIALCKNCHRSYDSHKTIESYNKLVLIKQEKTEIVKSKYDLSLISIEDSIRDVLTKLNNYKFEQKIDLNYHAKKIEEKLNNEHIPLQNKIKFNVAMYYEFIKDEFINMNNNTSKSFDLIASQIKTSYLKVWQTSENKIIIFSSLVDWLQSKTEADTTTCEVLISYFVQNCEVYD